VAVRRARHLTSCLAVAALVAAGCQVDQEVVVQEPDLGEAPEAGTPPEEDDAEAARRIERWIFDQVNEEREERGLAPLEWDEQLAQDARSWSESMAGEVGLEHDDLEEVFDDTEGFGSLGENISQSTAPVPAGRIHVGWMRSEGHRANVLAEEFDRLGVGVLCGDDGQTWATQRFGATGVQSGERSEEVPPEEPVVADEQAGPSCAG
jgi:uncharacterized protein YkwD